MKKALLIFILFFTNCAVKTSAVWVKGSVPCKHETIVIDLKDDPELTPEQKETAIESLNVALTKWNEALGFMLFDFVGTEVLVHVGAMNISASSGSGELGWAASQKDGKTCGGTIKIGAVALQYWPVYAHELGHILGLWHDQIINSVMNPYCCRGDAQITQDEATMVKGHLK